ncbi:MAG: 30S ribosomal protein S12 methylthiotransferase RimO, partial [Chloroflexota bacterium]|nr:30S ribosomal protein S12 methylthiotransferase RimO [Chloroflexota bacterium]
FVEDLQFDRLGAFQFSFEHDTTSAPLGDPISQEIKENRFEKLMQLQQNISLQKNQHFLGKILDVLIEGKEDGISVGRSYRDAPEIDGTVIVEGELPVGTISPVYITGAMTYDLTGIPAQ